MRRSVHLISEKWRLPRAKLVCTLMSVPDRFMAKLKLNELGRNNPSERLASPPQLAPRLGAGLLQVPDLRLRLQASQILRHQPTMAPVGLRLGTEQTNRFLCEQCLCLAHRLAVG